MIPFEKHIQIQKLAEHNAIESMFKGMSDVETHLFSIDLEDTYPIQENKKKPTFEGDKNIIYRIEDMVLGQFIMLEQIITGKAGLNNHQMDLEIAKLIIRPKEDAVFDNSDGNKEISNENDILSYDTREIYYVLDRFIERRNRTLFKEYAGVFYDPKTEEQEDESEENPDVAPNFYQQWYYYSIVRMLANEDVTKYDEIYMLPMTTVLPEMSYLSQKRKIEEAEQRKQEALAKLK